MAQPRNAINGKDVELLDAPRPKFKTLEDFCQAYEPLSYIVEGIIRSGTLYTLTAKTGHGKTGWLVTAALAVALGRDDLLGLAVTRGRVVYLSYENPDDVQMRFIATAARFSIPMHIVGGRILIRDAKTPPEDVVSDLGALITDTDPLSLVLMDTLAAGFDGDNLNDNVLGGEFMRRQRPFTRLPGRPAMLVAAHPKKGADKDSLVPYGAGAIPNEVDGNLTLWKEGAIASLHWHEKIRGLNFDPVPFRFDLFDTPDLLDVKGRRVQIPVCVPTTAEAVAERDAAVEQRNASLLAAIHTNPTGSQRDWFGLAGLNTGSGPRALKSLSNDGLIEQLVGTHWGLTGKGQRAAKALAATRDNP